MAVRLLLLVAMCWASTAVGAGRAARDTAGVLPAIHKVVTMLENLVSMVESEATEDEGKQTKFSEWANGEIGTTGEKINTLNSQIENFNAVLGELSVRQVELKENVKKLKSDVNVEQTQVDSATEKRNEESTAFVRESTDFQNAITACSKAITLLAAHYGDGTSTDKGKPAWMSLVSQYVGTARALQKRVGGRKVAALLQRQPNNAAYKDSSGEALNIVDEVKVLGQTFQDDYDQSKQDEAKLKESFEELMGKKNKILGTLRAQLDEEQGMLNGVNQEKSESEGALSMAEESLTIEQAYLSTTNKQLEEATAAYASRKKDRDGESESTKKAIEVLGSVSLVQKSAIASSIQKQEASAALVAGGARTVHGAASAVAQRLLAHRKGSEAAAKCPGCAKAGALLREQSRVLRSAVLSAAAAHTMGGEAIDDVVDALKDLIKRIDKDHKTEKEHRNWCEDEISDTGNKKDEHISNIGGLQQYIASFKELISMKMTSISQKETDIEDEHVSFEEATELRADAKSEYEESSEDHVDAIQAMNEAIGILAKFYASQKSAFMLLQRSSRGRFQALRGDEALEMMTTVRKDFEQAKANLIKDEQEAVADFNARKKMHTETDNDLHHDKDTLTSELQTAEQSEEAAESDLESNEGEKRAAESYLADLAKSCGPLIERFDERKKLRDEEKDAIKGAIKVLKDA